MDTRGGRITWYLDADDSGFASTNRRVREESRETANAVDRDNKRASKSIVDNNRKSSDSLRDFRVELSQTAFFVRNFQTAMAGYNMTSMILAVTTAVGLLTELGSAVITSTGSLLALPAIGANVATAFGVIKIATIGMGDAFKAVADGDSKKLAEAMAKLSPNAQEFVRSFEKVKGAFAPIQQAVQDALFFNLGAGIEAVTARALPALQSGLVGVSKGLNQMAQEALYVMTQPFFQGAVANVMGTTARNTNILTDAVSPLIRSLMGLVNVGLPFTTMLSEWVVRLSQAADGYINSAHGQQTLTNAINLGVDALKLLGDLVWAVGGFFVELFKQSNQSGMSMVGTLTEVVNRMTAWMQTAEGSRQMQALFEVTNKIFVATLEVLGKVALIILDIIEAFNNLPGPIQETVIQFLAWTAVLTPIATYFSKLGTSINTTYEMMKLLPKGFQAVGNSANVGKSMLDNFRLGMEGISGASQGGKLNALANGFGRVGNAATTAASSFAGGAKGIQSSAGGLAGVFGRLGLAARAVGLAITAAFTTNPIGWIVLAIVAVVAAFVLMYQKVEWFRNFWNEVWWGIQEVFDAVMKPIKEIFTNVINDIREQAGKLRDKFMEITAPIRSAWNSMVGAISEAFGKIKAAVQPMIDTVMNFIKTNETLHTVLKVIGGVILAVLVAPLAILAIAIGAVVAVIGALVFAVLWLTSKFLQFANFVLNGGIWQGIQAVVGAVADFFVSAWQTAFEFFRGIFNPIGAFFTSIFNAVIGIIQGFVSGAIAVFTALWSFIQPVLNFIKNLFIIVFGGILLGVILAVQGIWNIITTIFNALVAFWTTVLTTIWTIVTTVFTAIWTTIVTIMTTIWGVLTTIWNAIWTTISTVLQFIWDRIVNAFNFYRNLITSVLSAIWGVVTAVWNAIWGTISGILGAIWGVIVSVWNSISGFIGGVIGAIRNTVSGGFNAAKDIAVNAFNNLRNAVSNAINGAKDAVSGAVDRIKGVFSGAAGFLVGAGRDIIQGLINGIGQMAGAVAQKAQQIADSVKNKIKDALKIGSPSKLMIGYGKWTGEGLSIGLERTAGLVASAASNLVSGMTNAVGNMQGPEVSMTGDVADVAGLSATIGSKFGEGEDNSSHVENHIREINIASEVDGENWLRKLTRVDEVTSSGLTSNV